MPSENIEIPPEAEPTNIAFLTWVMSNSGDISSGVYYGDSSGGINTMYPDIRRVGCAFVRVDTEGMPDCIAHFPLPGPVQTVSRGELYSLVILIKQCRRRSTIKFWTDNKGVKDKFKAGPNEACKSSNCDLYHELFSIIRRDEIDLEVEWLPSHLEEEGCKKTIPDYVNEVDIKGNAIADKYAGIAADLVQVPLPVATECKHYYKLVKRLQWRLATIVQHLPPRVKHRSVCNPRSEKITLEQKISESSHTLERKGDRFTCISCLDSFTLKDPAFQHWLAGICMKAPEKCDRPVHINSNLHIGNANAHSSHRLRFFDGLVYCNRCGSRAMHHMRRLARPCRPPGTYGKLTLKYIREGRLPPVYED